MNILAINTSSTSGSIALSKDGHLTFLSYLDIKITHSERLMPQIDFGLKQSNMTLQDIDLLCLANGPGSFTGLRIGLATIKGIAFALEKPVLAINTLEILAYNVVGVEKPIACMLDAKMGEIYGAVYNSDLSLFIKPCNQTPQDFIKRIPEKAIVIGDGVMKYKKEISRLGKDVAIGAPHQHIIFASNLISIAYKLKEIPAYDFNEISALEPFYLRKSQAEIVLEKKRGEKNES